MSIYETDEFKPVKDLVQIYLKHWPQIKNLNDVEIMAMAQRYPVSKGMLVESIWEYCQLNKIEVDYYKISQWVQTGPHHLYEINAFLLKCKKMSDAPDYCAVLIEQTQEMQKAIRKGEVRMPVMPRKTNWRQKLRQIGNWIYRNIYLLPWPSLKKQKREFFQAVDEIRSQPPKRWTEDTDELPYWKRFDTDEK